MYTENRYEFIDITKGLGMILVIAGHLFTYGGLPFRIIFSFHMPLFFFVSGLFAKPRSLSIRYLKKISNQYLLPYFCILFIGIILTVLFSHSKDSITLQAISQFVYTGQPEIFHVGQIWFLLCLFNVKLLFAVLYPIVIKKNNCIYILAITVAMFFILLKFFSYVNISRLPWKWDTALIGLVFYVSGYLLNDMILVKRRENTSLFVICSLLLFLYNYKNSVTTNVCNLQYGGDFGFFIAIAFLGIISLLGFARFLDKYDIKIKKWLLLMGKNSLIVFGFHSFFIYLYAKILSFLTKMHIENMVNMNCFQVTVGTLFVSVASILLVLIITRIKVIFHLERCNDKN